MSNWTVNSIPWLVVLDESNKVVLSENPSEHLGDKIFEAMNMFPTVFVVKPSANDYIVLDNPPSPSVTRVPSTKYEPQKVTPSNSDIKIVSSRDVLYKDQRKVPPMYGVRVGPQRFIEENRWRRN